MPPKSRQHVALCLAWMLSFGCLSAQEAPGAAGPFTARVVQGQKASHKTRTHTGTQTVVEVLDANGGPVSGAKVTFQLPKAGPGGTFADRSQALTVETDGSGRGATVGFTPNSEPGAFPLYIQVSSNGANQKLVVWQTNSNDPAGEQVIQPRSTRKWLIAGAIAAGAIAGLVLATRSGGSVDPGYQPGPPVVGAPR